MTTLVGRQLRLPRPRTPRWLGSYAHRLYGCRCIRCRTTRPLEVAHLHDWPTINELVAAVTADPGSPLVLDPTEATWIFHQPTNVLLLCANCHTLYDGASYVDVTAERIQAARDEALATTGAAIVMREYFCRGFVGTVGSIRRNHSIPHMWMPLLDRLKVAYDAGLLPPPHRFRVSYSEVVDVSRALVTSGDADDLSLPMWTGRKFRSGTRSVPLP